MWPWNKEHKHYWVAIRVNQVSDGTDDKRAIAEVLTYRCWRCGSLRYDTVDGGGFVASKVTDDKGRVVVA